MIEITTRTWLPRESLDRLIALLQEDGRKVIGPVVRDSAIVYAEIVSSAELPAGVRDEQAPGRYRISRNGSAAAAGRTGGAAGRTAGPRAGRRRPAGPGHGMTA